MCYERDGSARVLATGATWRLTGAAAAGRALIRAATGGGEDERTLAGMLLVQAGDRSVPVLTEAILAGPSGSQLVAVLASIGSVAARDAWSGSPARVRRKRPVLPPRRCTTWTSTATSVVRADADDPHGKLEIDVDGELELKATASGGVVGVGPPHRVQQPRAVVDDLGRCLALEAEGPTGGATDPDAAPAGSHRSR